MYECKDCGKPFEELHKFEEKITRCPLCGGQRVIRVIGSGIIPKFNCDGPWTTPTAKLFGER